MKYQFFGDTHGEKHWESLLDESCIQVFLGDYFSPYRNYSYDECKDNFLKILKLKEQKPETILLLGNHDVEGYVQENYSRHDYENQYEILKSFNDNEDKFQVAFSTGNYLITHAGVSLEWKNKWLSETNINPQDLSSAINELWNNKIYRAFDFNHNSLYGDYCGTSYTHSPMWIRWNTLCSNNIFKKTPYKQIVGHTVEPDFRYSPNKKDWDLICIDCMAYNGKSLILDI